MIPSFDGTDLRQYERRILAGKLLERLERHPLDMCEEIQDWETPNGVENLHNRGVLVNSHKL